MTFTSADFRIAPVLLLSLLGPGVASAAWQTQSVFPVDRNIEGVVFISPTHGFLCAQNRHLLETTDGGITWQTRMADVWGSDPFYAIEFSDALHGYFTGNNNDAWRTVDGGATWQQMSTVAAGSWRHLDFLSPTVGFAGANGACAFTSDGGITWQTKSGWPTCPVIYGMDFRDLSVGLAGGSIPNTGEDGIFKTIDGGVSWVRKHPASANDVVWIDASTAVAIVGTEILRSTDSGDTWSLLAGGISTGLVDLEVVGPATLTGVSGKGDLWRSANGGGSWTMVFDGLGNLPASWTISFLDAQNGWVAGQGGMLLQTTDGGLNWALRNNGVAIQLYDVEMFNDSYGLIAGHDGYLLRTTNGGAFWETQKLEVTGQVFGRDEGLKAVSIVDADFAVAAGPGGTVFRTTDAGVTWESIGYPALPGLFYIEDAYFVDRQVGWLVGLDEDLGHNRTVYKTANGGDSWTQAFPLGARVISVDFADSQYGWLGTIGRSFLRTIDGGTNWIAGTLPNADNSPSVTEIEFVDRLNGWAVGWDGYVAHSTNGGVSWTLQNLAGTQDVILGLHAVSATEVWLTGRELNSFAAVVYHTTDAGQTWEKEVVGEYPYIPVGVSATPSGNVWIAGYAGRIQHLPGSTVSVPGPSGTPSRSYLGQVVPNPFRSEASIRYTLPADGWLDLQIVDVSGRVVESLANGRARAGAHTLVWAPRAGERSAPDVTPGMYFCRLQYVADRSSDEAAAGAVNRPHVETRKVLYMR